jgi:hypothetical protein
MDPSKELLLFLIKYITLYNASQDGWNIKQLESNKYELTKILQFSEDLDTDKKLEEILPKDEKLEQLIRSALELTSTIKQRCMN